MILCSDCGNEFDDDESYRSPTGNEICFACFHDSHFTCCLCLDYQPNPEQGAIGNLLVIINAEEAGMPTGLYEVVSRPYWYSDYISMSLYPDSLRCIGDVPNRVDTNDYPVGHLCNQCSLKAREEYELK
jgi:hypothetical protein